MLGSARQLDYHISVLTHCNENQACQATYCTGHNIVKKLLNNLTEYWDLLFKQLDYITKKSKLTYNLLPLLWSLWIFLTDRDKI
jgi:hypothetical protein